MRKSTLARIVVFGYGLNLAGIVLAAITHLWPFLGIHAFGLIAASYWLNVNYFDKEETNAVHSEK